MIKHLKIFFLLTLSLFAFDNAYIDTVTQEIEKDNVQTVVYSIPASNPPKELNVQKSELSNTPVIIDDKVSTVNKKIKTPKDIKIFTSNEVEPINYTNTISLNKLEVSKKKQKFFHMMLPAILISKANLKIKREKVLALMDTPVEQMDEDDVDFLEALYKKYKTRNNKKLANRLKTHPVSIILAQAAIESAWGESRFFKKGNNIFGMWSFNKNEPRIKALGNRNGKSIYVKKYANISEAIDDYFVVIGRGAYKSFRKQRNITDNPLVLVNYLVNYCELDNYPSKLRKFIVQNKLRKFDKFELASSY
ncbi:MAG: BAX protein [uncultured Sulfurovum sp.]|uniref:BAX protein n=1 Tax=uncultured Sulfurovum sp. TaxID=269237 RepID=A0A6S6TBN9_9BACT|nr:MAG: BAX protein [uncultured Sulfurovum sp.]